jgi:hypothetical protein
MSKERSWDYCGLYGDDDQVIDIITMPAELPDNLKQALKTLYEGGATEFYGCGVSMDDGYQLKDLGLARQVGNAWNERIMWAPQVHEWMKAKNNNDAIGDALRAQYVI